MSAGGIQTHSRRASIGTYSAASVFHQSTKQKESGPPTSYAIILDQKFSTAFYRSKWSATPVFIELLLNASILKPESDLSIFSGNFSLLKLVYYNPDYMHSSKTEPEPEVLPSIFDIY